MCLLTILFMQQAQSSQIWQMSPGHPLILRYISELDKVFQLLYYFILNILSMKIKYLDFVLCLKSSVGNRILYQALQFLTVCVSIFFLIFVITDFNYN